VLGSGGLVGSEVTKWLRNHDYQVLEVKNRHDIDLRVAGCLDSFRNISFVMFLACEVGGSKYIQDGRRSTKVDIIANNIKIYQNVFDYISRHAIPFLFSSSSLVADPESYGTMKRLGESWIKAMGMGKIARLWNIYNVERITYKSHVLADWGSSCVNRDRIDSMTDGWESRQFLHAEDCASAMGMMMEHYDEIELVTDVTSNQWVTMREVAQLFERYGESHGRPCPVSFSSRPAPPRALLQAKMDVPFHQRWWQPSVSLEEGVSRLFTYYEAERKMRLSQEQTQLIEQVQHHTHHQHDQDIHPPTSVPTLTQRQPIICNSDDPAMCPEVEQVKEDL